jgi:HK97 family phage prohead protease/HK97 family phage major capsid protein
MSKNGKKIDPTKYDFSGYATKSGLKCSDGRTILQDAFKHQDGTQVPLVWQHLHNEPKNILGHAILENREDGVYCYGKFNNTESANEAKELVAHGDISCLSIYANQLKEKSQQVQHGQIREVSLVLAGANPGASIENVSIAHGDGTWSDDETEVVIYSGLPLDDSDTASHSDESDDVEDLLKSFTDEQKDVVHAMLAHSKGEKIELTHASKSNASGKEKTMQEVFDTFSEEQKQVVYHMLTVVAGDSMKDDSQSTGTNPVKGTKEMKQSGLNLNEKGDMNMKNNVFDKSKENKVSKNTLTHDQLSTILSEAKKHGSLKESFLAHATTYGFDPIDVLFPDARDVSGLEVIQRNTDWVEKVLKGTNHTPFSRIRTKVADITAEEARAKGYVTGTLKKEEVITLLKRSTSPTTIYKKQKIDRDDMLDITDFDVVMWLKNEMRLMLNEEIARAVLLGDGRIVGDEDKINAENIRPIALDNNNVFVHRVEVASDDTTDEIIDAIIRSRKFYKGSGVPVLFISTDLLTEMLLVKDTTGHRIYKTVQELASVLRVSEIIEVELMNSAVRVLVDDSENAILAIMVNLKDYTIGADKGGDIAMFDQFDIDYNQQKYLIETRISGALTKPKSAIIIEKLPSA